MIPVVESYGLRYPTKEETALYWNFHVKKEDCKNEHCTSLRRVSGGVILLRCRCGRQTEIPHIKDEDWEDTVSRWEKAKENHNEWK